MDACPVEKNTSVHPDPGKNGDIRVVALEAEKGRLRLGIEAPAGYAIIREELVSEIKEANRQSALEGTDAIRKVLGDNDE